MTTTEQRLAALEAEVAVLRRAAPLREAFVEIVEERAYARGRESILGGQDGPRRPRSRHLRVVQGDSR